MPTRIKARYRANSCTHNNVMQLATLSNSTCDVLVGLRQGASHSRPQHTSEQDGEGVVEHRDDERDLRERLARVAAQEYRSELPEHLQANTAKLESRARGSQRFIHNSRSGEILEARNSWTSANRVGSFCAGIRTFHSQLEIWREIRPMYLCDKQLHTCKQSWFPGKALFKTRDCGCLCVQVLAAPGGQPPQPRKINLPAKHPRNKSFTPTIVSVPSCANVFSFLEVISQTHRLVSQERLSPRAGTSIFIDLIPITPSGEWWF